METLTAKRRDELMDWVVDQCTKRGLVAPAIMFLEVNRPLSFIASSMTTFFAPIIGAALPKDMMEEVAALLEDRSNIELLIDRLEKAGEDQTRRDQEHKKKVQEERKLRRLAREGKTPEESGAEASTEGDKPADPQ